MEKLKDLWLNMQQAPGKILIGQEDCCLASKFRMWNMAEFGNQDRKLIQIQNDIQKMEKREEYCQLIQQELTDLNRLNSEHWKVSKCAEAIWSQKSRKNKCKLDD
jgi:hypothetical protein